MIFELNNWKLVNKNNKVLNCSVPGDINIDIFNAGLVKDPYIAENYKELIPYQKQDFTYVSEFDVDSKLLKNTSIELVFKGIDLYSTVYLNDKKLGDTKNAFLEYRFNIIKFIKKGKNVIKVKMHSTINKMNDMDTKGYFAIFNVPRLFIRKPQCHFGWDWAPKICAYGITDKVFIEAKNKFHIQEVRPISDDKGNVTFLVETNYNTKTLYGPDRKILVEAEKPDNDKLVISISKDPFSKEMISKTISISGKKNFCGFINKKAQLWWPVGYGEQPLYNYKIELIRGNKVIDSKVGRFAYRSVKLLEEPKENDTLGMSFEINGKEVFIKGSNWVPIECFTGVAKEQKYKDLIRLAKLANINTLRVWGGGMYERDIFYDICDEEGIMVWQDVCLACADIPEEDKSFLDNLLKEVEYQVKRLIHHPSIIYWCGGNEKTGSYGLQISHGDFLVNNTLSGFIHHIDPTRPYHRQSPYSYTDVGNDKTSGDSHHGSFESALLTGLEDYRNMVNEHIVPFVSECAIMGPSSVETLSKIFPKDKLWPMNEMWKDRFMENPYGAVLIDFPHREMFYAENLYGKVNDLNDFVTKAMQVHAEVLRAEAEFSRAHKGITSAFLNWMYNDIWPSGTWATIDYYLEPKQAYYQMKKTYSPVLVSFYQNRERKQCLFAVNDTLKPVKLDVTYGVKTYEGKLLYKKTIKVDLSIDKPFEEAVDFANYNNDTYLFAYYTYNNVKVSNLYSPIFYHNYKFENNFDYTIKSIDKNHIDLTIKAKTFVKSLFIKFNDNYKYIYSDNYVDLEKGETKVIHIESKEKINPKNISFSSFK